MPPQTQVLTDSSTALAEGVAPRYPSAPPFSCTRSYGRFGLVSVHVVGELDLSTAPQLDEELREAQLDEHLVVLDLRELAFMDCAGLHVIVDAAERARRARRRLIVLRGVTAVDRIFTLAGVAERIEIVDHDPRQPLTDQGLDRVAAANGTRRSEPVSIKGDAELARSS